MLKENKNLDFLNVKFQLKQLNSDDPEYFYFEGYASTFNNIDRADDIIEKGAFVDSLKRMLPKLLWQHKPDMPLGVFTKAFEDEIGLYVAGKLPKDDEFVKGRVIPQIKVGSICDMSIGFNVEDYSYIEREKRQLRLLKRITLWEISLVTIPANPKANLTRYKSVIPYKDLSFLKNDKDEIDFTFNWDSDEAIRRIKEYTSSEDLPTLAYRDAFLWFDSENKDDFSAYKLPIADVVNGKLLAIPRAIFAAAAIIQGARGGIDIPDEEQNKIKNNIEKYYEKMGRTSPFSKSLISEIEKCKNIKDFSNLLKDNFLLTHSEKNAFIGVFKNIVKNSQENESEKKYSEPLKELSTLIKSVYG